MSDQLLLKGRGALCLFLFICGFSSPAHAQQRQQYPDLWELNPFGGVSLFGAVNAPSFSEKLSTGALGGVRAGYNFLPFFGLEASYGFAANNAHLQFVPLGNRVHSLSLNGVFSYNRRGSRWQPYLTAGAGPNWFVPSQSTFARSTQFALNYGGGVKYHWTPHFGLRFDARASFEHNPAFGLANVPSRFMTGVQATGGAVFYLGHSRFVAAAPVAAVPPEKRPTLQPLNPGELTGAAGSLCQGRVLMLHATATDPAGHTLSYKWKVNGMAVGTNNPNLSYTPNNAGDFEFEVEVADASDETRVIRLGPKTYAVQDYAPPSIKGVTASPSQVNLNPDAPRRPTVVLAADVASTPCNGSLTYQWSASEGSVNNATGPSALFDTASLNFDSGLGQAKTVTATLKATDEAGRSSSQSVSFQVDYPAQYKRLPDVVFAKNSARVNNCGKRILIEQAAPQAGSAFDILLIGHRSGDELESVPAAGRRSPRSGTLDRQRILSVAAVLTAGQHLCGNIDISQILAAAVGVEQLSSPDPALCGASNLPSTGERNGAAVSSADKERRVEVYLIPKGGKIFPPGASQSALVSPSTVRPLGCPQ